MTQPHPWWHSAVVYQIYPRSFADSTGDGIGDVPGIIGKLDYLADLGVDVLWLSPIYASPQDDNGYDISDYRAIDPMFGTLDDVDALIAGAHGRGMKVVMDLVVNHTSDEHAWFQESRDKSSDKADWYLWHPGKPGMVPGEPGAEPTGHGSIFGGSAWQFDESRGEYYLHIFSRKQPDLNWRNPKVREAVFDMMNWWVERGVDGFRMDVINLIDKPPLGEAAGARGQFAVDGGLIDGPLVHDYLQLMYDAVFEGRDLMTVGETPGTTLEQARRYTDPANRELNMVFQFEHMELDEQPGGPKWFLKPLELPDLKASLARWQEGLAGIGWNSLYWNNHDQPRIVSRWGDDSPEFREVSAKTLATVLHLHQGTPYIYQGEELGMTNAGFTSIASYRDLETLNAYRVGRESGLPEQMVLDAITAKSRDNARTPMQWDDSEHAGFTTGEPWLAVTDNYTTINAACQMADPDSVRSHYKTLIALRHDAEWVREGRFDLLLPEHPSIWAFTRTWGETRWLVVANMSSEPVVLPDEVAALEVAEVELATHDNRGDELAPWESRVLRLS